MIGRRAVLLVPLAVGLVTAWAVMGAQESVQVRWLRVNYGALIDGRRLTHSGEPVGAMLDRLGGRPFPSGSERREDALAYRLLDPILEPYAFVLSDALDSLAKPMDPPPVEVGALWETGEAQPAWVELVRARRFVLESDGEGHLRACLPASSLISRPEDAAPTTSDPVEAAKSAWEEAWPVLRHALAGERRRLARLRGGGSPALEVEVHAYRHLLAKRAFDLGVQGWRTQIQDTGPRGDRPPLDVAALDSLLARGQRIEGARLSSSGRVRWFTSEGEPKPTILGRPVSLADLAVAYRAVVHGGRGEPYMSLDRAPSPQAATVNYGGRLRDTALGWVSLLSDVRFKTFSVGIDLLGAGDVRDSVRRSLPGFRTHLERFASAPDAGAILNQQTRFWFYPDDVDLTLSAEGDVLAFRKVRMTAASERVKDSGGASADPTWTQETVAFLNGHYDGLSSLFPEMAELDESVRLLSLFTWLDAARSRGLAVPDLDVLLALDLPMEATPRRFPELLSHDVLPPAGKAGPVDVLDRTDVAEALDRLEPRAVDPLPAGRRFARDQALLDPRIPEQAELLKEMAAVPSGTSALDLDRFSYRAERLLMHARVLATISAERRGALEARRSRETSTRVFSVGIGGVDLGMTAALARAMNRTARLGLAPSARGPATAPSSVAGSEPVAPQAAAADPPGLPSTEWPDHGLGPASEQSVTQLRDGQGSIAARRRAGSNVRKGTFKPAGGEPIVWDEVQLGMEGPEVRTRRRIGTSAAGAVFERVEDGRYFSYKLERTGNAMSAVPATSNFPIQATGTSSAEAPTSDGLPRDLVVMDVLPSADAPAPEVGESPSLRIRLQTADGRERVATFPRALLQRLVRGREVDLTPEKPLAGFTPAADVMGTARVLMVLQFSDETRPPWSGPLAGRPGEENAARLAAALTRWWSVDAPAGPRAVVGVDPLTSPGRWLKAPLLDGTITLAAQGSAFPPSSMSLRAGLDDLPAAPGGKVLLLVSAEPPGVLGRRLRALAVDPASSGKILAVASFAGPLRGDLPASLLAEGKLAAFGIVEPGPVGGTRSIAEIARWARSAGDELSKGRRIEELPGPFTWFY